MSARQGAPGGGSAAAPRIDIAAEPLAELVRRAGADGRSVFAFLMKHLLAGRPGDSAAARAYRSFARAFIDAAAERDGFVELVATPETGGFFAQGWSRSLPSGSALVADAAEDLSLREVEVAHFARDDILPPGNGFCFFGKGWRDESLAAVDAVFFESGGRLLRLDVIGETPQLAGEAATAHVVQMLPRLSADARTLDGFKRICRPRFAGVDTLTGTQLPVAAALDMLLQAPDGGLLAIGWLLDPLHRVERALIKSTGNLYGQLDADWCLLPRPDLVRGFGHDPRFANLLDETDVMHGFVVHVPASREQVAGAEVYLEIVLEEGGCLFRPIAVTPFENPSLLPNILQPLAPNQPELASIVRHHLAPFLRSVRPARRAAARTAGRPIALGGGCGQRETAALMPFRNFRQLETVLALLAGTPEAEALDLVLVAPRATVTETLEQVSDAFAFYGVRGQLVVAPERDGLFAQLDLAAATTEADRLLAWTPSALPKQPGWLRRLVAESGGLSTPGLLSPALVYEDGSICFGGAGPAAGACELSGYEATRLHRGAARQAPASAPQIGLIGRAALGAAGGFGGALFSDAFAHVDLAERLRRRGMAIWCSGAVEFWCLDDEASEPVTPMARLLRQIDAALLDSDAVACGREAAA